MSGCIAVLVLSARDFHVFCTWYTRGMLAEPRQPPLAISASMSQHCSRKSTLPRSQGILTLTRKGRCDYCLEQRLPGFVLFTLG